MAADPALGRPVDELFHLVAVELAAGGGAFGDAERGDRRGWKALAFGLELERVDDEVEAGGVGDGAGVFAGPEA